MLFYQYLIKYARKSYVNIVIVKIITIVLMIKHYSGGNTCFSLQKERKMQLHKVYDHDQGRRFHRVDRLF